MLITHHSQGAFKVCSGWIWPPASASPAMERAYQTDRIFPFVWIKLVYSNRFNFESCDLIWKTVIGSCMCSNLSHGNSSHEKIFKRLSFHVILCVTRCDFLPSYRRKMTHHIITSDGIFQCLTESMHCKKCSYFRLVTTVSEGWTVWPEKLCNRALVVAYCRPQMRESMRNKNACFVF